MKTLLQDNQAESFINVGTKICESLSVAKKDEVRALMSNKKSRKLQRALHRENSEYFKIGETRSIHYVKVNQNTF